MSDESVRHYLAAELALPADWAVIPEQRFPETIAKTTVVLQHTRIEKLPEAPIGHLRHTIELSVIDPRQDIAKAEDALDDALVTLIQSLDGHPAINWTGAEKTMHRDTYVAWNLTLTVITSTPEPDEEPDEETEE